MDNENSLSDSIECLGLVYKVTSYKAAEILVLGFPVWRVMRSLHMVVKYFFLTKAAKAKT